MTQAMHTDKPANHLESVNQPIVPVNPKPSSRQTIKAKAKAGYHRRQYLLGQKVTWTKASNFCSMREGRLCSGNEICGADFIPVEGDHFAPTSDASNSWLSIGTADRKTRLCKLHHVFAGGVPGWGEDGTSELGIRGKVWCCGAKVPAPENGDCFETSSTDEAVMRRVDIWAGAKMGSPKLLCLIYTHDAKHANARAQLQAWVHKCDGFFFASNVVDKALGAVVLDYHSPYTPTAGESTDKQIQA
jgi:hypothetical protein